MESQTPSHIGAEGKSSAMVELPVVRPTPRFLPVPVGLLFGFATSDEIDCMLLGRIVPAQNEENFPSAFSPCTLPESTDVIHLAGGRNPGEITALVIGTVVALLARRGMAPRH